MPRANRLRVQGGTFHLTHRCHNRAFLLRFARDRDDYRARMRQKLRRFDLWLLDYCVTCNHVHLLVDALEKAAVSGFMREVASEFARQYNRRKPHIDAVWGDNFHATLVDSGSYLWECLAYIELNMVRSGAVSHPSQWEWQGYHEIMGNRRRYRLLALDRLCWRLGTPNVEEVRRRLGLKIQEMIAKGEMRRQPWWTENLAVGTPSFLERVRPLILSRRETEIVEAQPGLWTLRESESPYSTKTGSENAAKAG
jgi:putative transposase